MATATTARAARTDHSAQTAPAYPADMKQARNPAVIHAPLGRYVHQIEVSGEGRLLFVAGQVGIAPDGTVPADPVEQLGVALDNVMANLEAAGFEPTDVVKLTTYVVGDMDAAGRRAQLDRVLGPHLTTSTLVYVSALASPDYKVEVDAWATR
jgi:2-iminobutanoate/2-iminopropanoate deaminase